MGFIHAGRWVLDQGVTNVYTIIVSDPAVFTLNPSAWCRGINGETGMPMSEVDDVVRMGLSQSNAGLSRTSHRF
jgi:hypothetical protein